MAKVDYISFAICAAFFLAIIPNISFAKTIYVSPNNYTQVLENANSGDTIVFKDGVYNLSKFGKIRIAKSLHLKSENGPESIILLKDGKGYAIEIEGYAENVTIEGFTIKKGGILIDCEESYVTIKNNVISESIVSGIKILQGEVNIIDNTIKNNGRWGIFVGGGNTTIINNNISYNQGGGIYIRGGDASMVNNFISFNGVGISIDPVGWKGEYKVYNNTFSNNAGYGIDIGECYGESFVDISNNTLINDSIYYEGGDLENVDIKIANNTVNERPVLFINGEESDCGSIHGDFGEIIVVNCDGLIVRNLEFSGGDTGLIVVDSENIIIENNTFNTSGPGAVIYGALNATLVNNQYNGGGLWVFDVKFSEINNNTVNGKPLVYLKNKTEINLSDAGEIIAISSKNINIANLRLSGVILEDSENITIYNCTISNNLYGIYSSDSKNIAIINSSITDNLFGGILVYGNNSTIVNNVIERNNGDAISIPDGSNILVFYNYISSNLVGIELGEVFNVTVAFNEISENFVGIAGWGVRNMTIYRNLLVNNLEGIEIGGASRTESLTIVENTIENSTTGIEIFGHSNARDNAKPLTIMANNISNSERGVVIEDARSFIGFNTIDRCETGIEIWGDNNIIRNNTLSRCHESLEIEGNENTIENNKIIESYFGIYLEGEHNIIWGNEFDSLIGIGNIYGSKNVLTHNTFNIMYLFEWGIDGEENYLFFNDFNFSDDIGINDNLNTNGNYFYTPFKVKYNYSRITFESNIGNYWSNFSGDDEDHNGIIDTAYMLPDNNSDEYPLVSGIENYQYPSSMPIIENFNLSSNSVYPSSPLFLSARVLDPWMDLKGVYWAIVKDNKVVILIMNESGVSGNYSVSPWPGPWRAKRFVISEGSQSQEVTGIYNQEAKGMVFVPGYYRSYWDDKEIEAFMAFDENGDFYGIYDKEGAEIGPNEEDTFTVVTYNITVRGPVEIGEIEGITLHPLNATLKEENAPAGEYDICTIAIDYLGFASRSCSSVNVNQFNGEVNGTITFNATSIIDIDGNITKFIWDFGDGITKNTSSPIINHTYSLPGTYIVNLTVVDENNVSANIIFRVIVYLPWKINAYSKSNIPVNLTLFFEKGGITENVTMGRGSILVYLLSSLYNLTLGFENNAFVKLQNVNMISANNKTLRFDKFSQSEKSIIYAIEMNLTEWSQTNATVKLNYTSFNPDHIKLYTCHNWDFENRKCNGAWEEIPSFGIEGNYAVFNVSHFSAFKIEEEPYCGDGICNGEETCSSCPQDCGPCPEPSGGGSGGGGGGGGGFGGSIASFSQTCIENWTCTEWSECYPNGTQYRKCIDLNNCGTTKNKPIEVRSCTYECEEKWVCTEWSECYPNGTQYRKCVDVNHCNTTYNKPPEVRECNYTSETVPVNVTGEKQITGLVVGEEVKNILVSFCLIVAGVGGYIIYRWKKGKR